MLAEPEPENRPVSEADSVALVEGHPEDVVREETVPLVDSVGVSVADVV